MNVLMKDVTKPLAKELEEAAQKLAKSGKGKVDHRANEAQLDAENFKTAISLTRAIVLEELAAKLATNGTPITDSVEKKKDKPKKRAKVGGDTMKSLQNEIRIIKSASDPVALAKAVAKIAVKKGMDPNLIMFDAGVEMVLKVDYDKVVTTNAILKDKLENAWIDAHEDGTEKIKGDGTVLKADYDELAEANRALREEIKTLKSNATIAGATTKLSSESKETLINSGKRSKADLEGMKWQDLKKLASAHGQNCFGKGKTEVVAMIIKAQKKKK